MILPIEILFCITLILKWGGLFASMSLSLHILNKGFPLEGSKIEKVISLGVPSLVLMVMLLFTLNLLPGVPLFP